MNPTAAALHAGGLVIDPPVVLAPMTGITNRAFRRLCREYGAGLYVSEMTTSRALLERHPQTLDMIRFHASERPRSVQLYGVDPATVAAAVRMVADEDMADHVDLNFGCPVPKVTRKGGGSALPWKRDLFAAIVEGAVAAADVRVPVTVKMRTGIDSGHLTYREAGLSASAAGVAWVALHGRTADQYYDGRADWDAIADLVALLSPRGTPVLGNGDIWSARDAVAMLARTGCAGVVVGRGCLGRPWLFGQLSAALRGGPIPPDPDLPGVMTVYRRHGELLVEEFGTHKGIREFRKHHAWYFKGFRVPRQVRLGLGTVESLADVDRLLSQIDPDQPWPGAAADGPRGRTGGQRRPALPDGWLNGRTLSGAEAEGLAGAELASSGG